MQGRLAPAPAAGRCDGGHAGAGVAGALGTITRPDGGTQVTYEGRPLYLYSGDQNPGEASGQGIQGVWFAMTPSGPSGGGDPTPPPYPLG